MDGWINGLIRAGVPTPRQGGEGEADVEGGLGRGEIQLADEGAEPGGDFG